MSKPFPSSSSAQVTGAFLLSLLGLSVVACSQQNFLSHSTISSSPAASPAAKTAQPSPVAAPTEASAKVDPYQLAIERASSAYMIGRSAQSQDDWRLVANRWQQAIALMQTVPASNRHHQQAKQKLTEYRQHLAHAQQQARRSTQVANPDGVIVLPLQARSAPPVSAPTPALTPVPFAAAPTAKPVQPNQARIFSAPIIRREGNTPVVQVKFNGSQAFDMIVDTGASGTLITRQMANVLGVVPVAQAKVDTASQKSVAFPLGYVQSIEVGGASATNVMVAIAGPELDVGLLGHDFFGHYDVTIREKEVEFRERG